MVYQDNRALGKKALLGLQLLIFREEQYGFGQLYSFDSLQEQPKQAITFEKTNTYMNTDKHTILV